jgi:hypothetical protein
MSITGLLTDLSLPEIFQFIDQGHKTGLLRLRALPKSETVVPAIFYLWVYQGRIVAAANQLDQGGLIALIERLNMISKRVFDKLVHWYCLLNEPLGLHLKNQGVLRTEHLKQLFQIQVLQLVFTLFHLKEGQFKFDQNLPIPTREMTGFSVPTSVLNRYSLIEVLLEEIDNYHLNLKTLPSSSLNEATSCPKSCLLNSPTCELHTALMASNSPNTPHRPDHQVPPSNLMPSCGRRCTLLAKQAGRHYGVL